jgi:hypothetical protein
MEGLGIGTGSRGYAGCVHTHILSHERFIIPEVLCLCVLLRIDRICIMFNIIALILLHVGDLSPLHLGV